MLRLASDVQKEQVQASRIARLREVRNQERRIASETRASFREESRQRQAGMMQQVEQHGSQSHLAPAHLVPRTSSGLQSMMGSTSTKMDFDDEPHAGTAGAALQTHNPSRLLPPACPSRAQLTPKALL